MAEQIAKTAKFGGRWLDVGCGTGKLSAAVLQQQSNRHITGVNSITPMFDELIGVDGGGLMLPPIGKPNVKRIVTFLRHVKQTNGSYDLFLPI